jgi:pimeloyl-ACP methyl ester carboxylesterase
MRLRVVIAACWLGCTPPVEGEGEGDPSEGEGDTSEGEGEGESDPAEGEGEGEPSEGEGEGEFGAVTVLSSGTLAIGEQSTDYELIRLIREDGASTYVQWVRPFAVDRGNASVVVQTQPYEGIDWSGDAVDAAFAVATPRSDGLFIDNACNDADDLNRGVVYFPTAAASSATAAITHIINGHGVLLVFGRYYACDSVDEEALDMRAALHFLSTRDDEMDTSRVAVTGNSWGGFLALTGAIHAPTDVVPLVVVPINPPSLLARMVDQITSLSTRFTVQQLSFFDSYLHRIRSSNDPSRYEMATICDGLAAKHTLLLHDNWDTLVPFSGSYDVVTECGQSHDVQGLWWRRQGDIDYSAVGLDHGLLGREPGYPSVFTLSTTYLYAHLNDDDHPVIAFAARGGLASFLRLVHDDQQAGGDVEHARVRVLEAMSAGALFLLVDENAGAAADAVWTELVNAEWGTSLDATTLREQLQTGFPSP